MRKFRNPDQYYDSLLQREKENSWWRVSLRYAVSVVLFLAMLWTALYSFWTWSDLSTHGPTVLSWEHMTARAEFGWQELRAGRLGL